MMPAYGLAENTVFVCGRADYNREMKIIAVDAKKLRTAGVVEILKADDGKVATSADLTIESLKLVGCGVPGKMVDGKFRCLAV